MPAPEIIRQLVERYQDNYAAYHSAEYNETQARREFIDPLFKALGWDIDNEAGFAEAYKDVIHEDAIKIGGATKAPDYAFRIGGTRKFFVEAKKPSVNIKGDISPAFQLRRYAWSAKLPLSILTDFEELAIYDCRDKPDKSDKAATGRVRFLNYPDYLEKWDELAAIFSKQAVMKGSFDRYAEGMKGKHGTADVDDAFLSEIERWRELLARNLALRNPDLSTRELNYAVQMTIDRIIFLRICEDRGIEFYGQLQGLLNGGETYARLCQFFHQADARYNSGLFHFRSEKGQTGTPDELTLGLKIDDKPLKDILGGLYYPDSPYEFSVLPADILGQVYEQFLGKVIRLTQGHHAVVEDKPEVKKAGGVFYTPTYIVEYIVRQTVGEKLAALTPDPSPQGRGGMLRILDPACGSGSFLLGAYQYLLDWHRDRYVNEGAEKWAKGKNPRLYQAQGGAWKLTTAERKRVLLEHIYGVDIDPQAVEVTKLSLLLKVLEGESQQTINTQLSFFHERVLPDLSCNIKCGNSLIGSDFYAGGQANFLDVEEQYRINAFDWEKEFAQVFAEGGFDVVIGNPPYGAWFMEAEDKYFGKYYVTFSETKDIYTCFIEKGLQVLKSAGLLSFIVPSAWVGGPQYSKLRKLLLSNKLDRLILLPFDIFANAYVDTLIFGIYKDQPHEENIVFTYTFPKREKLVRIDLEAKQYKQVRQIEWKNSEDSKFVFDPQILELLRNLRSSCGRTIGEVAKMKRGVLFNKSILCEKRITDQHYRYFEGDVYRYAINIIADQWVEFGDKMTERPKEFYWFEGDRILLRRLVNRRQRLMASKTVETFITNKNLYSIKVNDVDSRVLLGVLNSKLLSFLYINQVSQATKDDFPQVTIKDILLLPFPSDEQLTSRGRHARMVSLVERMLSLHEQLKAAKTPDEKARLERQVEATDAQIDALVYELYGLTEEEVRVVEGR